MRNFNNQQSAAHKAKAMPFSGLGFAVDAVRAVAQTMTVAHNRAGSEMSWAPMPDDVAQPSGYSLLVALGREIRGR